MENIIDNFTIGHKTDAGLDIPFNIESPITLIGGATRCVALPLDKLNLKRGYCAVPFIRSKYANLGLIVQPSVIDAGYTGVCHIWLVNASNKVINLEPGTAYIQIVKFKISEWKKVAGKKVQVKRNGKRGNKRDVTR